MRLTRNKERDIQRAQEHLEEAKTSIQVTPTCEHHIYVKDTEEVIAIIRNGNYHTVWSFVEHGVASGGGFYEPSRLGVRIVEVFDLEGVNGLE